ncbi:MAG: L-2-hydroxyglutarate oxidase [Verrucomicrobia bacterium]|nr:L-2-hydroxyglutarate oxidase [Verrucomicrobiota bacterium]
MTERKTISADVIIIGAGIVGLATAYQLQNKMPRLKIAVLEKESASGRHQSSHNSGVIHSGVYYKPGSLKARNCTEGRSLLLDFCNRKGIPLKKMGKVIVATKKEELSYLSELHYRGTNNGLEGLKIIDKAELAEIEPHIQGLQALWVPNCFSINFQDVVENLLEEILQKGGNVLFGQKVFKITDTEKHVAVETTNATITGSFLVNCAGLHSDRIASLVLNKEDVPFEIIPFRGEYWELAVNKRDLVKGLVYPVPNPQLPFLGVHLSRMVDGRVTAGPNAVLAWAREGYRKSQINLKDCVQYLTYPGFWKMAKRFWRSGMEEMYRSMSKKAFVKDVQKLLPQIEEKDLVVGGAGVRAQLVKRDGNLHDDFAIAHKNKTLHVLNAPSPAATSCLSIGNFLSEQISQAVR